MYLDVTEKDPNRNRKTGLIIFIVCLIYIACVIKCAGQCSIRSKPYANYPNVTRIESCSGIGFEANGKDIFVGIYADSIKPYKYVPILYVFLPKGLKIKNPELLITFDNGDIPEMKAQVNDVNGTYIEFSCKDPYFHNVRNHKINVIHLINDEISYLVYEEKMDVFYEFMRSL